MGLLSSAKTVGLLPLLLLLSLQWNLGSTYLSPFASTFEIMEESPGRTLVNGVAEYLSQVVLIRVEMPNSTTFHLMGTDQLVRSFSIDSKTGKLRVAARIDREELCKPNHISGGPLSGAQSSSSHRPSLDPPEKPCLKSLNILIKSQAIGSKTESGDIGSLGRSETSLRERITLKILDINDNAPRWNGRSMLTAKFVEAMGEPPEYKPKVGDFSANFGDPHLIERAVDLDAGANGTISYALEGPGSDFFHLEGAEQLVLSGRGSTSGINEQFGIYSDQIDRTRYDAVRLPLKIRPSMPLDREKQAVYNLTLVASDMGRPKLSSSIPLVIFITDVNDNPPIFHGYRTYDHTYQDEMKVSDSTGLFRYSPSAGYLLETTPVGSLVLQLNATDADVGENSKLTYSFAPTDKEFAQRFFALDSATGQLKVKAPLDYDLGPRHFTFKVNAVDGAPEPYRLTGTAVVDIELRDVNDEPPKIEIFIAQNGGQGSIANDPRNQFGHLLSGSTQQELVAYIEETPSPDIVVTYVQVSDRDENGEDSVRCHLGPRDNFTLQAESLGQPTLDSRFRSAGSDADFVYGAGRDGSPSSRKVTDYHVIAKVPVTSQNQITTSETHLQGYLDRETTPSQLLTITCTDSKGNQAERKILLHLLDINDNPPRFLKDGHFSFAVPENKEPVDGQQIWLGRVVAFDPDQGENAKVTYRLAPELINEKHRLTSDAHRLFGIREDTGDVYAQMSLDREKAPENGIYMLSVLAVDNGKPNRLTSTATVEIVVQDTNDWAPEFTRDIYTFSVPEDADLREVIGVIEAIDRDATATPNSITYHLNVPKVSREYESGNNLSKRSPTTAAVISSKQKNATDSELKRVVRDVNRRNPEDVANRLLAASRSQPLFMPTLEPTKPGLQLPQSYFTIDSRTGEIRIIRRLDRETNAYFTFEVLAVDSPPVMATGPQALGISNVPVASRVPETVFTATATVVVTVIDANDNAPEFRYPNTSMLLYMAPDETLGHKILTVQAIDQDEGENARISYSIRSEIPNPQDGPGSGNFAIDETSGLIFLTRPVRGPVNHRLIIEACDHGVTPRCTPSPGIRITVSDEAKLGGVANNLAGVGGTGVEGGSVSVSRGDQGNNRGDSSDVDRFGYDSGYYHQGGTGGIIDFHSTGLQGGGGHMSHRIEVIAACLVVVFGVLLFAAVVLACLLKRKPRGHQGHPTTYLWDCSGWPFYRHETKRTKNMKSVLGDSSHEPGSMHDARFADTASIESSLAKGFVNGDSITNTLDIHIDEDKKPLYYEGIGMLPDPLMTAGGICTDNRGRLMPSVQAMPYQRTFRHHIGSSVAPGYTTGGAFVLPGSGQQAVLFNGPNVTSGSRVYGTLPLVSTILPGNGLMDPSATVQIRQMIQPPTSSSCNGHQISKPVKMLEMPNPPSPDYQSLDVLTSIQGRVGNTGNGHWLPRTQFFPQTAKPIMRENKTTYMAGGGIGISKPSASYGCLINQVESPTTVGRELQHNYYEINALKSANAGDDRLQSIRPVLSKPAGNAARRYQRSATLGRLVQMDEDDPTVTSGRRNELRFTEEGELHHPTAGDLTILSGCRRTYSQLKPDSPSPSPFEESVNVGHSCDKPSRYTYQAIREASFV